MDTTLGVVLPKQSDLPREPAMPDITDFAREVETLGYDSLWSSEGWGTDAFLALAAAAAATDSLRVGTSIVNVFTRTPAGLAMAAATLSDISDGRAVLGLGVGHPKLIEKLHGIEFEAPLKRANETMRLVRQFLGAGDEIVYEGDLFHLSGFPPLDRDVPMYGAALGEANRRLVGRRCDGWLPYHVPFSQLAQKFEAVETGARQADRDPSEITVAPYVPTVVSEDGEAAVTELRYNVASYIGKFDDDSYKNAVGGRYAKEVDAIATAWRSGDEEAAVEAVTEDMALDLGIAGTPSKAREQLTSLAENPSIDLILLAVPHATSWDRGQQTLQALAPSEL